MKVLASDFDNTMFFEHKYFKNEDIHAIREFQKEGNLFGICSGRPFSGLLRPLKGILKPDFFIVSTGGAILDKDYHLLYGKKVPFDTANEIYLTYKDEIGLIAQTLSHDKFYCTLVNENDHEVKISSLQEMKDHDLYSISLIDSTVERAKQITLEINKKYKDVRAYQNVDSVDVVEKSCSKGKAIMKLKDLLNIDHIAGIGDSFNDLPMLEVVDQSFTFHDSPILIKEKSNYVVENVKEAIDILNKEIKVYK